MKILPLTLLPLLIISVYGRPSEDVGTAETDCESYSTTTGTTPPLERITPRSMTGLGKLTAEENEELQKQCGHYQGSQRKSIGSEAANRKEAPWAVGMAQLLDQKDGSTKQMCSATLISDRHVLTAWHCLKHPFKVGRIQLAENITFDNYPFVFDDDCSASHTVSGCSIEGAIVRKAVKAISLAIHPMNFEEGHKDVTIFELESPVQFGPNLYPACLSETRPNIYDIIDIYAFGGDLRRENKSLSGALQHVELTTEECARSSDEIKLPECTYMDCFCHRNINGQQTFHGDSGGGVIHKRNGRSYVTGVVSAIVGLGGVTIEGWDIAIAHHLQWICKHTGICVDETKEEQITGFVETITSS